MTQNDMMKTSFGNNPSYGKKELQALKDALNGFDVAEKANLYLLYSREEGYFTIFQKDRECKDGFLGKVVVETITEMLGDIVHSELYEEDGAYGFWIRPNSDTLPCFYLLMNWDGGVVKYRG